MRAALNQFVARRHKEEATLLQNIWAFLAKNNDL